MKNEARGVLWNNEEGLLCAEGGTEVVERCVVCVMMIDGVIP